MPRMVRNKSKNRDPADPEAIRARALRAVTRREYGARELQAKLVRTGASESVARQVVEDFAARGWQSDARYAESVARVRIGQGYGPLRIRAELQAAGVADTFISAAIQEPEVGGWLACAHASYAHRFHTPPADAAGWQKAWRFLAQRGFSAEHIRSALKNVPDDAFDSTEGNAG